MGGVGNSLITSLAAHAVPGWCAMSCSDGPAPFDFRLRDRTKKKAAAKIRSAPNPNPTASPAISPVWELLSSERVLARGVPVRLAAAFAAGAVVDDASDLDDLLEVGFVFCGFGVNKTL